MRKAIHIGLPRRGNPPRRNGILLPSGLCRILALRRLSRIFRLTGIFLFLWLFVLPFTLQAQVSPFHPSYSGQASRIQEEVTCFTDRSLYITDEAIRFQAKLRQTGLSAYRNWSSVLYAELISSAGKQVLSGKFRVHKQECTGQLFIPPGIPTGNYLLRTYTRWMRNRGAETYSYVPLKIINPHEPELVPEEPPGPSNGTLPARARASAREELVDVDIHPSTMYRGDSISLRLRSKNARLQEASSLCLSVVPVQARPSRQLEFQQPAPGSEPDAFRLQFLPDLRGPLLSGTVMEEDASQQARANVRIHLTILGEQPGYYVTRSDDFGRFAFSLTDHLGKMELFIQAEHPEEKPVQLRVERDFDPGLSLPALEPFRLSADELKLATLLARKVQLAAIYRDSLVPAPGQELPAPEAFYGSPSFQVDLDDYVQLPTLEEVFYNLVPNVLIVRQKKANRLLVRSENPSISLYDPLIMIDELPCFDLEQVLAIPPSRIQSIDVVEDVYVKGDQRFGGLVNLRSVDRDMAGINLPAHAFFIDFRAVESTPPLAAAANSPEDRLPDTRNTLLWVPLLTMDEEHPLEISFRAPDYPGEYLVLIRSTGDGGELFWTEATFFVE